MSQAGSVLLKTLQGLTCPRRYEAKLSSTQCREINAISGSLDRYFSNDMLPMLVRSKEKHRHGYSPGAMQHSAESKVASESQDLLPLSTAEWSSHYAEQPVGVFRGADATRVKPVKAIRVCGACA